MTDLPPTHAPATRDRRRWVVPVIMVVAVALVGSLAWYLWPTSPTAEGGKAGDVTAKGDGKGGGKGGFGKGGAGKGGGRGGSGSGGPQPVSAVAARIGDVNVVQSSIGTVTALRTATVRPRVDGLLQTVPFTEGQLVTSGDLLAQIDPAPFQVQLQQVEGQLARDAAQLNNARLDLDRYKTLLAQDSIAGQQVDQQAAMVRQLEGTVKFDQAQVDNAKLQLSWTRITAPIPGRLGLRLVDPGNMVRSADANGIAVITQVDPITVLYTIPQDVLPRVLAQMKSDRKMGVEAWDRDQKNLLSRGNLITADNQIDVSTGTVKLKAQFSNPKDTLYPNQFVNVRMVIDTRKGAVVVPSAAVQRNAQGNPVVYVVKEDSTATVRPVTPGPTEGTNTAIEKGLAAGELVITDGVDRIREGAKVEVTQPSLAGRPGRGEGAAPDKGSAPGKGGGDGTRREEYRKRLEAMPPGEREALKKKLEAMTPEQREEFRKRREAARGQAPQ